MIGIVFWSFVVVYGAGKLMESIKDFFNKKD